MSTATPQVVDLVDGMRGAIGDFQANRISIDRLAWELKSRIATLHQVGNDAWADELKAIWNQLEVLNSGFIESKQSKLNSDEQKEVADILSELSAAIIEY